MTEGLILLIKLNKLKSQRDVTAYTYKASNILYIML